MQTHQIIGRTGIEIKAKEAEKYVGQPNRQQRREVAQRGKCGTDLHEEDVGHADRQANGDVESESASGLLRGEERAMSTKM